MPAAPAAPLLEPAFPASAAPPPPGGPLPGRELYRHAVRRYLNGLNPQQRASEPLARRRPSQWDRAAYVKWDVLPSVVRRRWEAESRRLWPRYGDDPNLRVLPEDVFCNSDETYYARRRKRKPRRGRAQPHWDWTDGFIHNRFRQVYNAFPRLGVPIQIPGLGPRLQYGQASWEDEADKIDHARGFAPQKLRLQGLPADQGPADNGRRADIPTLSEMVDDIEGLWEDPDYLGPPLEAWRWHKTLGAGGQGVALLYRRIDPATNVTQARVVVKKELEVDAGDSERVVFEQLKRAKNAGFPCQYIIGYIGSWIFSIGQDEKGYEIPGLARTYLDYAPFGDFYDLIIFYQSQNILLPEPFLWYLLLCLAEAAEALERHVPGEKQQMWNYDLKPENILVNNPDVTNQARHWHAHYPVLQMADLGGVGTYPDPGEEENDGLRGMGTDGYRPFELLRKKDQEECNRYRTSKERLHYDHCPGPKDPLPVDEKMRIHTTIYQIGMVLWLAISLCRTNTPTQWRIPRFTPPTTTTTTTTTTPQQHRETAFKRSRRDRPPRHPVPRHDPVPADNAFAAAVPAAAGGNHPPAMDVAQDAWSSRSTMPPWENVRPQYSARLVECVYRCLEPRVEGRPTVEALLAEVRDVCAGYERRWPVGGGRPRGVVLPVDKYPIGGLVLNDVYT